MSAGQASLALALGVIVVIVIGDAADPGVLPILAPVLPEWAPYYWSAAGPALILAAIGFRRGERMPALATLAAVLLSLMPTALFAVECARGNCL